MKISFTAILLLFSFPIFSQGNSPADGDWKKQFIVLKNTREADAMVRVGDIDNLNCGWDEGFNPFSGRSTSPHEYPWKLDANDAAGTDKIMVPTGFKYGEGGFDGYTAATGRPDNIPKSIVIPLTDIKDVTIQSASLLLFVDDFQSPFEKKFQFRINGSRFIEAEKIINNINQEGPIGKLITLRFTAEQLSMLKKDSLVIFIDDAVTPGGDGYAIDFVKLLINPKDILYKGSIKGKIIDEETKQPIPNAMAEVKEYSSAATGKDGNFLLKDVPAGLAMVTGSASGYSSAQKQSDVIADQITEELVLELKRSGKVKFNNNTLQEGDDLVMKNIQFEVNSAVLLPAGRAELDKLAALMKENMTIEIQLSGYTSSEGSAATNRELSLKRVKSCKDYLASKGVDEGRIAIRGLGPDKPIASNDTEAGRAKNRRVEMKITKL